MLNWWELWNSEQMLTLDGLLNGHEHALYLEINKDFNLHLKADCDNIDNVDLVRRAVKERLEASAPGAAVASRPEFQKQDAHAIWEWDLDLPLLVENDGPAAAVKAIGVLLDDVIPQLA